MAIGRILLIGSTALFSIIAITAVIKKSRNHDKKVIGQIEEKPIPPIVMQQKIEIKKTSTKPLSLNGDLPYIDRIYQFFSKNLTSQFPIVETISYSSSVSWLAGRPAWLNDYADYYQTSSSFILRSLDTKEEYFSQKRIVEGSRFNVFRRDKTVEFYLLVDISRCKMGFYYFDVGTNERVLLKTYSIGLGKLDPSKPSGSLTPLGKYLLGKRVATYQLGSKGVYQNKTVEMITVFGTHWIPFEQEIECTSESVKGYGLQGSPWIADSNGQLIEDLACIGDYSSNGCIRLASKDIGELFSIIITKPTFIEIVKDFKEATLPGIEVAAPSR
ncbi:L,D-transpeptidase [Candidatus Rhabdochlamydia porcellionis]|uniref:L,D-TPase catalytic domain-containing protein n=1 Tax=Candidatus Rhabdochlamydia porcellionis TaxID=225148 RepID=A0ABX8YZW0_9BACT|nr:L,D-transpeptidase [Candidatus Rhabdochlamydia porcellionis]QZA58941.1 hypothetical protein RHAB15C_0000822 [Candidatus Rhabdochlamydia porcellionis]